MQRFRTLQLRLSGPCNGRIHVTDPCRRSVLQDPVAVAADPAADLANVDDPAAVADPAAAADLAAEPILLLQLIWLLLLSLLLQLIWLLLLILLL